MTTIACDGKSMAGDGMITDNDHVCLTDYQKVHRLKDGRIVGAAGDGYNWQPYLSWLDDGAQGEPPKVVEGLSVIVLQTDGSIVQYDEHGRTFPEKVPCAIGSGCRFALAAMDLGKSAEDAVAYAATRDIYTGGTITALTLEPQIRAVA